MKNICVPVDFTHTAMNALKYAIDKYKGDNISVIYVSPSSLSSVKTEHSLLGRVSTIQDDLTAELRSVIKLELGIKEIPSNVSLLVLKGDVVSEVQGYVRKNDTDVVVMGTRDKYDIFDKLIGTTSLALVKTLNCPVILIPRNATYKAYKKIIVALDTHAISCNIGNKVKEWNDTYNAFVKFLHIVDNDKDFQEETDAVVSELFSGSEPKFGFELSHVESKEIGSTILSSAYNFGADLIISTPGKQNFLSALFFKSVTKELIQKVSIPILFLHKNDEL